jgi:hypothetical protein
MFPLSHRLAVLAFGIPIAVWPSWQAYVRADGPASDSQRLRVHAVPWERIHKIILRPSDPWAQLLLNHADGRPFEADLDADKRQLMGIQTVDGPLAAAAVNELRVRHRRFLAGS